MDNQTVTEDEKVEAKDNAEESTEQVEVNAEQESQDNVEELKVNSESDLEKTQKEAKEWKEKYFYLAAEMDNFTKRAAREKEDLLKYGNEKVLKEMVAVIDNFERTVNMIKQDEDEKIQNIVVGIEMIQKQFLDSLKSHGLEQVEALGKEFDPNFHEAMSQIESEDADSNTVIQEFEKGYILNGRLLRPTKVVIAK